MEHYFVLFIIGSAWAFPAIGHAAAPPNAIGGSPLRSPEIKWSTLGVVADGKTDNTKALNSLPTGVEIVGDCPAGGAIVVNSTWTWRSHLHLSINPGCPIVSYVAGTGNYAISQENLDQPISDVSINGLQISKNRPVSSERIMMLWANDFTLLHWTITASGGAMFLRGSNQEIAYGRVTGTVPEVGNPGIRHIGNLPKVPTSPGRPANVYIHDNAIESGDAPYQACQPLSTRRWVNVSSDDILYENNSGRSFASVLILVGFDQGYPPGFADWSCTNIRFERMSGAGKNMGALIAAADAPNRVSNILLDHINLDASSSSAPAAALTLRGKTGLIENVTAHDVVVKNTGSIGVSTVGNISRFIFKDGRIDGPRIAGLPVVLLQDGKGVQISDSVIGVNGGDAVLIGSDDKNGVRHPATAPAILRNTIQGIGNNRAGVRLVNVEGATIDSNTMIRQPNATASIGIIFTPASKTGPGTTKSTARKNNLLSMNHRPSILFAPNQGNTAVNNPGSPNYK